MVSKPDVHPLKLYPVCAVLSHFSLVRLFANLRTAAHQASLPMGFSGKNTGVGHHSLLQEIFPTQGSKPRLLSFLRWQTGSLPLEAPGKPQRSWECGSCFYGSSPYFSCYHHRCMWHKRQYISMEKKYVCGRFSLRRERMSPLWVISFFLKSISFPVLKVIPIYIKIKKHMVKKITHGFAI